MKPRFRLQQIAERLQAVFLAGDHLETVRATQIVGLHAVQDIGWLLQRETGLRARLQETLRQKEGLERRVAELELAAKATPAPAPVPRGEEDPDPMDPDPMDELREISNNVVLGATLKDAFTDDEEGWFDDDESEAET